MVYGLLLTVYIITALFLGLAVLIQKGQNSLGLGNVGGASQMLFGGSGGQDFMQKLTWFLGGLFIFLSLFLAIKKSRDVQTTTLFNTQKKVAVAQQAAPNIEATEETPSAQ